MLIVNLYSPLLQLIVFNIFPSPPSGRGERKEANASDWCTQIEQITVKFHSSIEFLHYVFSTVGRTARKLIEKLPVIWGQQILRSPRSSLFFASNLSDEFHMNYSVSHLQNLWIGSTHSLLLNLQSGLHYLLWDENLIERLNIMLSALCIQSHISVTDDGFPLAPH